MKAKSRLLSLLAKLGYQHRPEGFTLASGAHSTEYIDCRKVLSRADAKVWLGELMLPLVDARVSAVGGLTMGADPIACVVSMASFGVRDLRSFSVRKDAKEHGLRKLIEGHVVAGDSVLIVDDVVTTGASTIDAIRKARAEGLKVVQVLILVDREEAGGIGKICEAAGSDVPVLALFTKTDIVREWARQQEKT